MLNKYPLASLVILTIFVSALTTGFIIIPLELRRATVVTRSMKSSFCSLPKDIKERNELAYPGAEKADGWQEYKSQSGFSFRYPPGYTVGEGEWQADPERGSPVGRQATIYQVDESGNAVGTPSMLITTRAPFGVDFSLWEGLHWEYFEDVIRSFDLNPEASAFSPGPPSQEN